MFGGEAPGCISVRVRMYQEGILVLRNKAPWMMLWGKAPFSLSGARLLAASLHMTGENESILCCGAKLHVEHLGARLLLLVCGARLLVVSLCMTGENESILMLRGEAPVVIPVGRGSFVFYVGRGSLLHICACQVRTKAYL